MNVSRVARMSGESISATSNGSFFRGGRTSMKIWSSDRAAWPVIGVTMLGCAFTTIYGCNLIFRHPDVMFNKDTRSVHIRDNQEHVQVIIIILFVLVLYNVYLKLCRL